MYMVRLPLLFIKALIIIFKNCRFSRKNRIFGGLWFGYSKPDFCTFLRPFAQSLHDLYQSGIITIQLKI